MFQVYGGNDGWSFIEETSYKLVIDTILEEEEKTQVKNSKMAKASTSDVILKLFCQADYLLLSFCNYE